jgi:hypothetical protein
MARHIEIVIAAGALAVGCGKHADRSDRNSPPPAPTPNAMRSRTIDVPRAPAPVPIDGEWEPAWNDRAARVIFHVRGGAGEARPYSEMRMMRDGDALLVGLYAADEEIHSDEAFVLTIGALSVRATAGGALVPPLPGAKIGLDVDGTPDHPGDYDEEWKLEISIPIAALGAPAPSGDASFPVHVLRCDTPKDGIERCGAWDGAARLGH